MVKGKAGRKPEDTVSKTAPARNKGGRPKGYPKSGGRGKGTPNKVTVEARQAASALVDDPAYRKRLLEDMRNRTIAPAVETMLWHYAKGKPPEHIQSDLNFVGTMVDVNKVKGMSTSELEGLRRSLRLALMAPDDSPVDEG